MSEKDGSRLRSRLRLAALLAGLPIALATTGSAVHTTPAPATTAARAGSVMDLSGAVLMGRSDHGGDRSGHHSGGDHHDGGGDHHDSGGDHHDSGGDHHDSGGDHHDSGGDHHDSGGDHHDSGGDHHDSGGDTKDKGGDHHDGGGDAKDNGGDHHGGEKGGCSPQRESVLEAITDGLCTTAETLERALTGAK